MKKLTSFLLATLIVFTMLPINAVAAFADDEENRLIQAEEAPAKINWKRTKEGKQNTVSVRKSKLLNWKWTEVPKHLKNFTGAVWDNGNNIGIMSDHSSATWKNQPKGGMDATFRRFRGTFKIPKGYSTKDTVMLSSVAKNTYKQYGFNDGNIIPINDNIYIFIYKENENINNRNFMDYLAFWTGTSNQNDIVNYNGVQGTEAVHYKNGNLSNDHPLKHVDGWYCDADFDNIGRNLFNNYKDAKGGEKFVIDVVVCDYSLWGGMDELEITFKKATDKRAVINYYKGEVSTDNLLGSSVKKNLYEGYQVILEKGTSEGEINQFKNQLDATVYGDGEQRPESTIIGNEEETTINVVYPLLSEQSYKIENYFMNTDGKTYKIEKDQINGAKLNEKVTVTPKKNLQYYTFDVGNPNNKLEGTIVDGSLVLKVYYTRNQYNLKYNANLPEGTTLAEGVVPVDKENCWAETEVSVAGDNGMKRSGYKFDSWNTQANGKGKKYSEDNKIKILKDTGLFAQWKKDESQWHKVIYTTDIDATSEDETKYFEFAPRMEGEKIGIDKFETTGMAKKENHIFTGWECQNDKKIYTPWEVVTFTMPDEDVVFLAQWKKDESQWHKVIYTTDIDATSEDETKYFEFAPRMEGEKFGIDKFETTGMAKKENHIFTGWECQNDKKIYTPWEVVTFTMPDEDVVFLAQWKENDKFNVTYDTDGAKEEAPTEFEAYVGSKFNVSDVKLTKPGYKFKGWDDGSSTYLENAEYIMPSKNVTFKAIWGHDENDKFNVTYDTDGAKEEAPTKFEAYVGSKFNVSDAKLTKSGYKLMGWDDGDKTYPVGAEYVMPSKNVTFKAQWVEIKGTVSITHRYFTNNKLDGEISNEDTEVGYEFSILNFFKALFGSYQYQPDIDNVIVERRLIDKEEGIEPIKMMVAEPLDETKELIEEAPKGTTPDQDEQEAPKNTTPGKDEQEASKDTTPGKDEQEAPKDTTPGKDEQEAPKDTTPGKDEQEVPKDTTPGKDEQEVPKDTTPGKDEQEAPKDTTPGKDEQEAPKDTTPGKDEQEAPKDTTPGKDEQEAPKDTAPGKDEQEAPKDTTPGKDEQEAPKDTTPVVDGEESKVLAATSEDIISEENEEEVPKDTAPEKDEQEAPKDTAPDKDEAEAPKDTAPEKDEKEAPKDTAPDKDEVEVPKDTAPEGDEEEAPKDTAPDVDAEEPPKDTDSNQEDLGEIEDESANPERAWEEVEAVDGKYIFEEGYEYKITVNYYRTESTGGGGHHHHHNHSSDDSSETVIIPDEDVPLANKPDLITIVDDEVPLGKLPKTGGNSLVIGSACTFAAVLVGIKSIFRKKED